MSKHKRANGAPTSSLEFDISEYKSHLKHKQRRKITSSPLHLTKAQPISKISTPTAPRKTPPLQQLTTMERPFEGKCMHCIVDKQGCVFEPQNPTQCTWCVRHRYRCSETELDNRRRKLSGFKCDHCRDKHHKCLPEDRVWPDRCNFCKERNLPCSPPMSRRTRALSTRRGNSPGGRLLRKETEATGSPEPMASHSSQEAMDDVESDRLQPPFLSLMKLLEISSSGGQTASLLALSPPESPELMNVNQYRYDQPRITILEPAAVTAVPLSSSTKRRLFHFLYAAGRPLTLAEISLIPAINTETQLFQPECLLRLRPGSATLHLSNWFGGAVKYTFCPAGGFVEVSEEYIHHIKLRGGLPNHYVSTYGNHFVSPEEAHAEALLVCAVYLSLSNGGASGADNLSGMGFIYSDDNDLTEIMRKIATTSNTSSPLGSQNQPSVPYFYSLWKYATLNWPRHLVHITRREHPGMTTMLSNTVSLASKSISSLLLSGQMLTWLENLSNVLHCTGNCDAEPLAFAHAHVYGIYQRWVQSRIRVDSPANVKLYARTMHWISSLNSIDIMAQIQRVTDQYSSNPTYNATSSQIRRKLEVCKLIQLELHKVQGFDETMSLDDCEHIANNKMDIDSQLGAVSIMAGAREPCVYDPARRMLFYVDQKCWSGGSLQLECIDMETGLVLGRDWTWTKRFDGWRSRVIVAKSATHIALQVVAERPTTDDRTRMQGLLITYVVEVKKLDQCQLGENVLQGSWLINDEVYDIVSGSGSYGTKHYPNLWEAGHLVFSPDGTSLQTPRGVWDLKTRKKISDCTTTPTLVAVSPDGNRRVHAELDLFQNCYSKLYVRDNNTGHSQAIFGIASDLVGRNTIPGLPDSICGKAFCCRYVGFSPCGTVFLAQIEYLTPRAPIDEYRPKELSWFLWERKQDVWELQAQALANETQFWPLLKLNPWLVQEVTPDPLNSKRRLLCAIGSLCSVHRPSLVESA